MNKININWQHDEIRGWIGTDADGNAYYQGELRETTSVVMADGRESSDWTPEGALAIAKSLSVPADEPEHPDSTYTQEFDEFSDADPGL